MENPIKMDDLGVPLFLETPTFHGIPSQISKTHFSFPCNENHAQVHLITSNLSPGAQLDTVMVGTFPRCLFVRTNAFSNNKNTVQLTKVYLTFQKSVMIMCQLLYVVGALLTVVIIFTPINNVCKWLPVFQAFSGDLWKICFVHG